MRIYSIAILLCLSVLLMGCPKDKNGQPIITCPSLHEHDPEFWDKVGVELDMIENKAPNIMSLLDELRVDEAAIEKCLENQKLQQKVLSKTLIKKTNVKAKQ